MNAGPYEDAEARRQAAGEQRLARLGERWVLVFFKRSLYLDAFWTKSECVRLLAQPKIGVALRFDNSLELSAIYLMGWDDAVLEFYDSLVDRTERLALNARSNCFSTHHHAVQNFRAFAASSRPVSL